MNKEEVKGLIQTCKETQDLMEREKERYREREEQKKQEGADIQTLQIQQDELLRSILQAQATRIKALRKIVTLPNHFFSDPDLKSDLQSILKKITLPNTH